MSFTVRPVELPTAKTGPRRVRQPRRPLHTQGQAHDCASLFHLALLDLTSLTLCASYIAFAPLVRHPLCPVWTSIRRDSPLFQPMLWGVGRGGSRFFSVAPVILLDYLTPFRSVIWSHGTDLTVLISILHHVLRRRRSSHRYPACFVGPRRDPTLCPTDDRLTWQGPSRGDPILTPPRPIRSSLINTNSSARHR